MPDARPKFCRATRAASEELAADHGHGYARHFHGKMASIGLVQGGAKLRLRCGVPMNSYPPLKVEQSPKDFLEDSENHNIPNLECAATGSQPQRRLSLCGHRH